MRHCGSARIGATLALATLVLGPAAIGGAAPSGIPAGGRTPAFTVHDVTGAAKGTNICYV